MPLFQRKKDPSYPFIFPRLCKECPTSDARHTWPLWVNGFSLCHVKQILPCTKAEIGSSKAYRVSVLRVISPTLQNKYVALQSPILCWNLWFIKQWRRSIKTVEEKMLGSSGVTGSEFLQRHVWISVGSTWRLHSPPLCWHGGRKLERWLYKPSAWWNTRRGKVKAYFLRFGKGCTVNFERKIEAA